MLQIPAPASGGLEDLGALEAAASHPMDPLAAPQDDGMGGFGTDPLAAPQAGFGTGAQPAWQGQAFGQPQPPQKKGMSKGLILGLAGGGVALLLLVVGGVLAAILLSGGSNPEIAVNSNTPGSPSTAPVTNPADPADATGTNPTTSTDDSTSPMNSSSSPSGGNETETGEPKDNDTNPENSGQGTPGTPNTDTPPGDTTTESTTTESTTTSSGGEALPLAAIQWQKTPDVLRRGAFPPKSKDDDELVILQYSWMTQLLPHLGHQELYDKFDFNQPWTRDPNLKYTRTVIPQFLNPADDRKTATSLRSYGMGLTHFVGMSGIEKERQDVAANYPRSDPRAGVFGYKEIARPADIKDGTSQTIMIVGAAANPQAWVKGGGATVRGAREPFFDKFRGLGSKGTPKPGTLTVMADGSVRFISSDIDPAVFRAMCTINGKDTVDQAELGAPLRGFSFK